MMTMAAKTPKTPMAWSTSDLDLDDLLHPPEPDEGHEGGAAEHVLADLLLEQNRDVRPVHHVDGEADADGQQPEDDGAHPAFGGEGLDLAAQALAGRHGLGHRLQQLGQVPADLPLDADG